VATLLMIFLKICFLSKVEYSTQNGENTTKKVAGFFTLLPSFTYSLEEIPH